MRFFILVVLLIGVVVALFYLIILPEILKVANENGGQNPVKPDKELECFTKAKNGTSNDCDVYLKKYPKGRFAKEVLKLKKEKLAKENSVNNGNGDDDNDKPQTHTNGPYVYQDPSCPELKIPEPGPEMREFEKNYPEKWINPADGSEMLLVRAGTFTRGSNFDRNRAVEKPEMKIYVSSFYVDKYPITHEQFRKFINDDGYSTVEYWSDYGWVFKTKWNLTKPDYWKQNIDPDNPVVGVSWYEAEAYCRWAGKVLLTEVQWEKAARGYYGQRYPWGDKWENQACNWKDYEPTGDYDWELGMLDGFAELAPVYQYRNYKSPFGAFQMSGNAYEWVLDYWSTSYFKKVVAKDIKFRKNPLNSIKNEAKPFRVLKGGSFDMDKEHCEPSWRHGDFPERRASTYGFRCGKRADLVYEEYLKSLKPDDSPDDDDETNGK